MPFLPDARAALVIAHPGHELRVHRWLEVARPLVFVLTDGSGRSGLSRLNSTTKILSQAGAKVGSIFGRFTDAEIYASILEAEFSRFTAVATELAESFLQSDVDYVAGDASEGYNPGARLVSTHLECSCRNNQAPQRSSCPQFRLSVNRPTR